MAQLITTKQELKKYLEARKEMVEAQVKTLTREGKYGSAAEMNARGIVFGFSEAIKAVDAFILTQADAGMLCAACEKSLVARTEQAKQTEQNGRKPA